jgi:hypothetical protein
VDKSTYKELFFLRNYVKGVKMAIYVNTTALGVIMPPNLYNQSAQKIELGLCFPVPIPDLTVDHQGIRATLSFNRSAFLCSFPWNSIFCIKDETDDDNFEVFPEDAPKQKLVAELPPTGTDSTSLPTGPFTTPRVAPVAKPKRTLPEGWGGLIPGGKDSA